MSIASLFTNPTVFGAIASSISGQPMSTFTNPQGSAASPTAASKKSAATGQAATDLGLGDQLKQQATDQEEEERKRKMLGSVRSGSAADTLGLGGSGGF